MSVFHVIVAGVGAAIASRWSKLPSFMFHTRASGFHAFPEPVGAAHCVSVALVRSAIDVTSFPASVAGIGNHGARILRQCAPSACRAAGKFFVSMRASRIFSTSRTDSTSAGEPAFAPVPVPVRLPVPIAVP